MNYLSAFKKGKDELAASGIADADTDAEMLLMHVCRTERGGRFSHPENELTDDEESLYLDMISKRASHIPLQHLTGTQCFMGMDFGVSGKVLVPRPDTEILVEEVMKDGAVGASILDLCTGSGCIILSLLKYVNESSGIGTDISEEALDVARENAEKNGICAGFIRSDLFENVDGKYDVITSNPPYIRSGDIAGLMPEVRDHDPKLALDGGEDGLVFYRRIISEAPDYLNPAGRIYLEIGFDQGEQVKEMCLAQGFKDAEIINDYSGLPRVVKAHI
ncbi:MAG: peptide chain release factor N(5)-glutamine methyltransferase [Lachnospiraceae bacterium]|nr:peptide chain release factor N(5)-glutamine methyltransferase [Lachnospiraceae bacterium]